jgi:hypothetical protein
MEVLSLHPANGDTCGSAAGSADSKSENSLGAQLTMMAIAVV